MAIIPEIIQAVRHSIIRRLKNFFHLINAWLASLAYRSPAKKLIIIAVTGTDGKTTTCHLIYHLLKKNHQPVALISSLGAFLKNQAIDTGFHVTTPAPWLLQSLLRKIVRSQIKYLVLEVTSHGLDQHRLYGCCFHTAVITNITPEHLDYHPSFTHYLATKAKILRSCQYAVLNQDDESFNLLQKKVAPPTKLIPYSLKEPLDYQLKQALYRRFPQTYNQANALAAIKVSQIHQLSLKTIIKAIVSFPAIPGRLQPIKNNRRLQIIIDFAHTPNGLANVLSYLKKQAHSGQLIAVFGSAGLRDHLKRPLMGQIASRLADHVVLTAEDPRTERVSDIIAQISRGADGPAKIYKIADRQAAIDFAIQELAKPGDTIAILGKGHEKSICYGTSEYPWSDERATLKALKKRNR